MERGNYNCDDIRRASKKTTVNIFLPYKTPILHGAIKIIKDFTDDKDDGVDYINLCKEIYKYVNVQKECINPELRRTKEKSFKKEWKDIISGLRQTLRSKNISKICYWEGDTKEDEKKYVLEINDKFRKFCMEKKKKETTVTLHFDECMEYLEWVEGKKKEFQSLDPGYMYIKSFKEYFNIRYNCNYPWLLNTAPDVSCSKLTKVKARKKDNPGKSVDDTQQASPDVSKVSPVGDIKVNSPPPEPSSKVGDISIGKSPNDSPEKTSTQITSSPDTDVDPQSNISSAILDGTAIIQKAPIFQRFPYSHPNPDDEYLKFLELFYSHRNNLDGQKITEDIREPIYTKPISFPKTYPTYVQSNPIASIVTKRYDYISPKYTPVKHYPPSFTHIQPFQSAISRAAKYTLNSKPWKPFASFFDQEFPPHPTLSKKKMDIVKIPLPTPDPSLFRSPFMIYFLYTTFGLLFSKKTKKKLLKRQLEIKKIREPPHFFNIDNHSINVVPYENEIHEDKNIYNQMIIQKRFLKKNISIPQEKKSKKKAIIDIHMELFNESKNNEWELQKNNFLEICLEEIMTECNEICVNSNKGDLIMKSISIKNTKEEISFLWDKWADRYTHIWRNFKRENAFKVLQYDWREEEKVYLGKIQEENNILNEKNKIPLVEVKKDIWRKWIKKQATLIQQYKKEQWFKSLVEQIEDVSDEYKKEETKDDIFVLNIKELKNKENNEELYKLDKYIFLIKAFTQIFMMVLEECIKEESPEKTEFVLDNTIGKLNKGKCQNIKSHHAENTYEKSKDHLEYNEMLEKDMHKYKDSFKELMEGWTNKPDIDINSIDDKNKSDKWVEMTDKNFLNPNDDTSENHINYIRE
ncbi:STP1 protein [Plasmodium ovale wallikeri]|uniref:STP1 protein n=1 Tax=Plasmodium ovale wallikeri TaxID=864142 RepID=A0A1A9AEK2_PLAOA|nr:STP1 protein [Plasmodium ovale wallikeri]